MKSIFSLAERFAYKKCIRCLDPSCIEGRSRQLSDYVPPKFIKITLDEAPNKNMNGILAVPKTAPSIDLKSNKIDKTYSERRYEIDIN